MKQYWKYLKTGFKGWITTSLAQIIVFLPFIFVLTLIGLEWMDFNTKWIIIAFLLGLIMQWIITGYLVRKLWGWK